MRERHGDRVFRGSVALVAAGIVALVSPVAAPAHHDDPGPELGPPPVNTVAGPTETTFRYKGALITTEDAARKGLACNTDGKSKTRCYDSEREMDRAEALESRAAMTRTGRSSAIARAANHVYSTLRLYQYHAYGGWVLSLERHCRWFDVPSGYDTIQAHASIQDLPGQYDNSTNSRARACL